MSGSLRLSLDALVDQPWALLRSTFQQIVDTATTTEATTQAATRQPASARRQGVISVIPIHGVIEHRASLIGELLGGTSVESVRAAIDAAVDDPDVAAVVLDVDSPGGGVIGVTELAAEIREARERLPIVAVANGTAASAAYWLASQADRVYAIPSGQVGSIGIFAVHMDMTEALAKEGVKPTIISAGEHKTDALDGAPLTDEGRADMQRRVDANYERFLGDVAMGRNVSVETVRDDYGQGRVFGADEALEAGLIDFVGTLDTAIRQLARDVAPRAAIRGEREDPGEALPFSIRVQDQATDMAALVAHARVRADLRAREGRAPFSADIAAALRSIRDDALSLTDLLSADPAGPATPAVDPPAVAPPASSHERIGSTTWRHIPDDHASEP